MINGSAPSREEVLGYLAEASLFGNLGLFVGAGFSKALAGEDPDYPPLSWGELLKKVAAELEVPLEPKEGLSYPELASALCKAEASAHRGGDYEAATGELKWVVGNLSGWEPDPSLESRFRDYLLGIEPAWIVTTNYDLVVEAVLGNRFESLGPNQRFVARKGLVPVYHLHGIRTDTDNIVITQEDYVKLFRPYNYRQTRLAIVLSESTTLFLGYGLGDVNVLTAVDWLDSVFNGKEDYYPNWMVQAVRCENPTSEPYLIGNKIIAIEIREIAELLEELAGYISNSRDRHKSIEDRSDKIHQLLLEKPPALVSKFCDEQQFRLDGINYMFNNSRKVMNQFIVFLAEVFDKLWLKTIPKNAFSPYATILDVILDLLDVFGKNGFDPIHLPLARLLARNFERLAPYIGKSSGQSYAAWTNWCSRRSNLPALLRNQWIDYATRRHHTNSLELLNSHW